MGGGGGGTTTTKFQPPEYAEPYIRDFLSAQAGLSSQPYEAYTGQRVSDINPTQQAAAANIMDVTSQGSPDYNASRGFIMDAMSGAHQSPFATMQTNVAANPYAGSNPHLQGMIDAATGDITSNYRNAIAPSTLAQFQKAGAFGGSAMQDQMNAQEATLGKALANATNSLRFGDYTTQQGLAENAINRGVQAQQFDRGMGEQSWQANMARAAGLTGQAANNWMNDLRGAQAQMGVADLYNAQQQRLLTQGAADWSERQGYPQSQLQAMIDAAMRGSGGFGVSTGSSTAPSGGIAPLLGGALVGYGLTR